MVARLPRERTSKKRSQTVSAGLVATQQHVWPEEITGNKTQENRLQGGEKVRQWSCPPFLRDRARLITFSGFKVQFYNRFVFFLALLPP